MPLTKQLIVVIGVLVPMFAFAQDPRPPVFLEHADSVLGTGTQESGIRRYEGNVRFRQGNVTVRSDRATEYIGANSVDLMGRVVVRQGDMELRAPFVTYDGNLAIARARGGVFVREGSRTIRAHEAVYSPETRQATFSRDVLAQDDSVIVGSDAMTLHRTSRVIEAWGRVVMSTVDSATWIVGDSVTHDPNVKQFVVIGNARLWSQARSQRDVNSVTDIGTPDSLPADTLYLEADTLHLLYQEYVRRWARGNANLRRGNVASRSRSLYQDDSLEVVTLSGAPILWSDSSQLTGDSIIVYAPKQRVRKLTSRGAAFMVSRSGSSDDRFDQISGARIEIDVEQDTIQEVFAQDDAKSLYFRFEGDDPQGLAQFASDSIRVSFLQGQPEDIRWLGGVRGEQHPENVVAGRETEYRLTGFQWNNDRPRAAQRPHSHGGSWRSAVIESTSTEP